MKGANTAIPNKIRQRIQAAVIALLATLCSTAFADYQQTLAAQGADAFTPTSALITIDQEDIDDAFSAEAAQANPALSDQDVMIDLQSRIRAENQLERAAKNLEPAEAETEEVSTEIAAR